MRTYTPMYIYHTSNLLIKILSVNFATRVLVWGQNFSPMKSNIEWVTWRIVCGLRFASSQMNRTQERNFSTENMRWSFESINRLANTATPFKLTFNLLKAISVATYYMTLGNHFPNSIHTLLALNCLCVCVCEVYGCYWILYIPSDLHAHGESHMYAIFMLDAAMCEQNTARSEPTFVRALWSSNHSI